MGSMTDNTAARVGTQRSAASAFVADMVAIGAFGLFARIAHQTEDMPLNFLGWLNTTWPFWLGTLLAWALMWFGVTGKGSAHRLSAALPVWLCTVVVGLLIWGLRNGDIPHWSFILVASTVSALLLWGWRAVSPMLTRKS